MTKALSIPSITIKLTEQNYSEMELQCGNLVEYPDGMLALVTEFSSASESHFAGVCVREKQRGNGMDWIGLHGESDSWPKYVNHRSDEYNGSIRKLEGHELIALKHVIEVKI